MAVPTLLELAESGAHYGHHRSFVYPKARDFVYGVKHNVALINLEKTQEQLEAAQKVFDQVHGQGKAILFVGTKRGVRDIVKDVATSVGASYVAERWLGGFLTNFETISENIKKMNELDEFLASDQSKKLSKIDRIRSVAKLKKYHRFLVGVTELKAQPELLIMASASQDKIALREAKSQGIPIIALCDTDTNPETVDYPIPANDDAPKAVELILRSLVSAPAKAKPAATEESVAEVETAEEVVVKPKKAVKKPAVEAEKAAKPAVKKPAAQKAAVKKVAKKAVGTKK